MKNLIDVAAMKRLLFIPNKIKKSMICISIVLIINGAFSNAIAGNMLNSQTMPDSGVNEPDRPKIESNNITILPKLVKSLVAPSDFIPTLTGIITSSFGNRTHPVFKRVKRHKGIDISAPRGSPILAPASGKITFSGWMRGYGNVIKIDHENGYTTLIAHNQKNLVRVGQTVHKSQKIGLVGSTGIATGPHMHVEITHNGVLVNPLSFVRKI